MEHRILIVDKDIAIREFITLALIDEGFKVAATKDSFYALQFAQHFKPDMLIVDVPALDSSGASLLRTYRQSPLRQIPALVLTTAPNCTVLDPLVALGGVQIIPKPFQLADLMDCVTK